MGSNSPGITSTATEACRRQKTQTKLYTGSKHLVQSQQTLLCDTHHQLNQQFIQQSDGLHTSCLRLLSQIFRLSLKPQFVNILHGAFTGKTFSLTIEEPRLHAGVFILCVSTQQVSGQQDARYERRPALLPYIAKVTCYHVDQKLQSQHALCSTTTQTQTRGQEHEPADQPEQRIRATKKQINERKSNCV